MRFHQCCCVQWDGDHWKRTNWASIQLFGNLRVTSWLQCNYIYTEVCLESYKVTNSNPFSSQFGTCPWCPTWTFEVPFGQNKLVCRALRHKTSLMFGSVKHNIWLASAKDPGHLAVWKWRCRYIKTVSVHPSHQEVYEMSRTIAKQTSLSDFSPHNTGYRHAARSFSLARVNEWSAGALDVLW